MKEEKLNSIYLLYGEEKYLLETKLKEIKSLFGECVKGINYIIIDEKVNYSKKYRFIKKRS